MQMSKFLVLVGWELAFNSEYFRSFFEFCLCCLITLDAIGTLFLLSMQAIIVVGEDKLYWALKKSQNYMSMVLVVYLV